MDPYDFLGYSQARLVVEHPRSTKEAWDLINDIFNDNKRSRIIALKAELRSLKLGNLSIDAYFRKIESVATMLTSLGSPLIMTMLLRMLLTVYRTNTSKYLVHLGRVYTSPSTLIGGDPRKNDMVDMKEAQGNKAYTLELLDDELEKEEFIGLYWFISNKPELVDISSC
ncbi:hypothetical protein Tco_1037140 [Tanacetum coccineum]